MRQPNLHREGYGIFVRCCGLSPETPLGEFVSTIETLDSILFEQIGENKENFFPSPYGGAIYRPQIGGALDAARALAGGLADSGISAAIGVAWGRFQRTTNVHNWNAAALPLNQAARLAFCDAAIGHVLVAPHVKNNAGRGFQFSDERESVVKGDSYRYHAIESEADKQDSAPSQDTRTPETFEPSEPNIVLWDIVKYSTKDPDEQAKLSHSLALSAETALDTFGANKQRDYSPTGDGGFALFHTGLRAIAFAKQLGKYATAEGITIRTGIIHGEVAFAKRGPVGPGVLRADAISAQALPNGIVILADVWRNLDRTAREDWRSTEITPDIFRLEPTLGASDPGSGRKPAGLNGKLPSREEELGYLRRLRSDIEEKARLYSPLRGIAEANPEQRVSELLHAWKDDPDIALLRHRPRARKTEQTAEKSDYNDILTAFGEVKQAALLGKPGAGKSTTLRKLAMDLAEKAEQDPAAPLPLLANLGEWRGDEPLADFLAERIPEVGWAARTLSESGRAVLLLDGLNEVPTAKRADKAANLLGFKDELARHTPFIVSCRSDDYVGDLALHLDTLSLEPLSPQRVRAALQQWVGDSDKAPGSAERLFWQLAGDERLAGVLKTWQQAGSTEESFWSVSDPSEDEKADSKMTWEQDKIWRRHVPNPRSLLSLAANPFMLTMLYQNWVTFDGKLPSNRGELFDQFVNRLLLRERLIEREAGVWRPTAGGKRLLSGLADLAWRMQSDRIDASRGEGAEAGVLTVVSRGEALEALGGETLLKKAQDGTLLEGDGEIRFRHQLLQEYFAARALEQGLNGEKASDLWPPDRWWERSGWEEACVLLAGFHADDCGPIILWLAGAQPEVAAQCILDSGAEIADKDMLLKELHDAWMPRLTDVKREPRPEARAAVGRALGRLNLDDREGVGLRPDGLPGIDWVEIPGGDFVYQEGEHRDIETFFMARYPVTNAQFQAFLKADDGYWDDRWWKDLDEPVRETAQPSWNEPNHPRETVSWYEAVAFCAWLSYRLDREIRLPTEWQWEWAARGVDGREYPWVGGYLAGHANIDEKLGEAGHRIGRTSAVGIYPNGVTPEGVMDLSGNVWEWCLNEYRNPERTQLGGTLSRVLRGGSWLFDRDGARGYCRGDHHPDFRLYSIGFRVVCSSHMHLLPVTWT